MTSRIPRSIQQSLIFVDTSAHYALADRSDSHHIPATASWRSLHVQKLRPVTTNFILAESHALILRHMGYQQGKLFVERLRLSIPIERVAEADEERAWEIITQHYDKEFTCVDATSFAFMERFGIKKAFAFDKHFAQYGFTALP